MIRGKKIAIDARMIEMSGIGTYIQHLINTGTYDVALGNEEIIHKYNKTIPVIDYDYKIYALKEQLLFPNKEIHQAHVDLIHFPHYNVPISYHGDYVVTIHDLTHIALPELVGNKIKQVYAKKLMTHTIKHAKHIFTVSQYSKEDIIKVFHIPEEMLTVTYNAVDEDYYVKNKTQVQYLYDKYNIPRNKKIILYVGNLKPHKNLERLLNAFSKSENKEKCVIVLVGKAFDSENIQAIENKYDINGCVICSGMVSKKEIVDFYNLADIFAFPSLYEGFGIPALESMACGTPVICSNKTSLPEVAGNAALYFDPYNIENIKDAIDKVISNHKLQEDLIQKGFKRYKMFNWMKTVELTQKEIARVAKEI